MSELYLHCRECYERGRRNKLAVALVDERELRVVCENHDPPMAVGTFPLAEKVLDDSGCEVCSNEQG